MSLASVKEAIQSTKSGTQTGKWQEAWKYTDVAFLEKTAFKAAAAQMQLSQELIQAFQLKNTDCQRLVFVNGYFAAELSVIKKLPAGVALLNLTAATQEYADLIAEHTKASKELAAFPFASLNTTFMQDGVFLYVPKNTQITTPIHITFLTTEQSAPLVQYPRNFIVLAANSQATILEEYVSLTTQEYFTNVVTEVCLEDNAQLNYYKLQNESGAATHLASTFLTQKNASQLNACVVALGSRVARDELHVNLQQQGAGCSLNGFYCLNQNGQHIDNHLHITHAAAHSSSNILYKGVVNKKSRAVFNGKVVVQEAAQKVQAKQSNQNLLLSTDAEVDTKPELEIYADDIQCSHAATVGQLNADELFYLQARGIPAMEAKNLLVRAYAVEVLQQIKNQSIKEYCSSVIDQWQPL